MDEQMLSLEAAVSDWLEHVVDCRAGDGCHCHDHVMAVSEALAARRSASELTAALSGETLLGPRQEHLVAGLTVRLTNGPPLVGYDQVALRWLTRILGMEDSFAQAAR